MAATTPRPPSDPTTPQHAGVQPSPHRDLTGAKTTVARQTGVLGHLARSTRENAHTQGIVFAAHELFRMESLLRAFRNHLLAQPLEIRADSYNGVLTMIELLIQREALSGPAPHPERSQPSLATRADCMSEHQSKDGRARSPSAFPDCDLGRRRHRARAWRSFAAHACHRSLRTDRRSRAPSRPAHQGGPDRRAARPA